MDQPVNFPEVTANLSLNPGVIPIRKSPKKDFSGRLLISNYFWILIDKFGVSLVVFILVELDLILLVKAGINQFHQIYNRFVL